MAQTEQLLNSSRLAKIFIGAMAEMAEHLPDKSGDRTSKQIFDSLEYSIQRAEIALAFAEDENSEATDND